MKNMTTGWYHVITTLIILFYSLDVRSEPSVGIEVEMPGTRIVMAKFDDSRDDGKKWEILDWKQEANEGYDYMVLRSEHSSGTLPGLNNFENALELRTEHCDRGNYRYCEFEVVSAPITTSNDALLKDMKTAFKCFYDTAQKTDWTDEDGKKSISGLGNFIPASKFIEKYHACLDLKIPDQERKKPWVVKEIQAKLGMSWYFQTKATAAATQVNYGVPLSSLVKGRGFINFFKPGDTHKVWVVAQDGASKLISMLPGDIGISGEHRKDLEGLFAHVISWYGRKWFTKDTFIQLIKTHPNVSARTLLDDKDKKKAVADLDDEALKIIKNRYGAKILSDIGITNAIFKKHWNKIFVMNTAPWIYADKPLGAQIFGKHVGVVIESRDTNSDFNKGFRPNASDSQFQQSLKLLRELQMDE